MLDRPQACACRQNQLADGRFLTLRTDVLALAQGLRETHSLIRLDLGVFLHLDAIGTGGNRRSGENARTGSRLQRIGGLAGKHLLADHQRLSRPVSRAQGIPVHGTVGPGR
ncbi:hypothetical protein D3C85_1325190 [compost metagenome]